MVKQRPRGRAGRPAAGPGGEKRSEMRQLAVRLSERSLAQVQALAAVLGTSQADVVGRAIDALARSMPPARRKLVEALLSDRRRGNQPRGS